jgi:hypothetical protein
VSAIQPSFYAASQQRFINVIYSSPSNNPGTSPDASKAFIHSKNADPSTLLSSKMKQIFSPLIPDLFITYLKSSSKSSTA